MLSHQLLAWSDYFVLSVSALVATGESITSMSSMTSVGGKGVIQAIGVSRAGQRVELLGAVGRDGEFIPRYLSSFGVGTGGCTNPVIAEVRHSLVVS